MDRKLTNEQNKEDMGGVWLHVKTGKTYAFVKRLPMKNKTTREWEVGVIYAPVMDNKHAESYIRELEDFKERFIKTDIIRETVRQGV